MSIELIIDNREHELIQRLKSTNNITVKQLDVGDIIFQQDGEVILIIERKSVKDLKASICDGRSREQKARLLGNFPRNRIMYLIEGSLNKPLTDKISGLPVSTLIGSLVNTQLRDGIKVYKTSSIEESVEFLRKLMDKLEKDGDKYFNDEEYKSSVNKYVTTLKKSKKANMTPENWFIAQLSLIPQVTEKVAVVIVEKYSSVKNLVSEYNSIPENLCGKLLSDLTFPVDNGKKVRRIGDKISKRIYSYIYGIRE